MYKEFKINQKDVLIVKRRRYVRTIVSKAIRNGDLVRPEKCNQCGINSKQIQSHHRDYGKPLDVMWLCTNCHGRAHRKNSPLNPDNNDQTPMPFLHDKHEKVSISFSIPVKEFTNLLQISQKNGKSIAKLVKDVVIKSYPVQSDQLELNFEEKNDKSQSKSQQRVSSVAANEIMREKPKISHVQELWCERNHSNAGMAREFWSFYERPGNDASELRRVGVV